MVARCETILNTTMAEYDTYHDQKVEDFRSLTTDFLDSEIALHEQVGKSSSSLCPKLTLLIRVASYSTQSRPRDI